MASSAKYSEPGFEELSASQKPCLRRAQRNSPQYTPFCVSFHTVPVTGWNLDAHRQNSLAVTSCFCGFCTGTLKELQVHRAVLAGFIVPFLLLGLFWLLKLPSYDLNFTSCICNGSCLTSNVFIALFHPGMILKTEAYMRNHILYHV